MVFVFPESSHPTFWMKSTYMPLNMIFIDAQRRVLGVVQAEPLTLTGRSVVGASKFVVELNAGTASRLGIVAVQRGFFPIKQPRPQRIDHEVFNLVLKCLPLLVGGENKADAHAHFCHLGPLGLRSLVGPDNRALQRKRRLTLGQGELENKFCAHRQGALRFDERSTLGISFHVSINTDSSHLSRTSFIH